MSRLGEVWEISWAAFPVQLLAVVREDQDAGSLTTLDLLTGEEDLWLASDLKPGRRAKVCIRRFA